MARDPICGMHMDEKEAENRFNYQEKTYYFCTPLCMVLFQTDPEKYLKKQKTEME